MTRTIHTNEFTLLAQSKTVATFIAVCKMLCSRLPVHLWASCVYRTLIKAARSPSPLQTVKELSSANRITGDRHGMDDYKITRAHGFHHHASHP